ncbi:MAG: hypothetical protein U0271_48630 [Polyangiaceae bacterium]
MSSKHEWLNLLEVSGPFLAVPVLREVTVQGLEELDSSRAKRLRSAYEEWRDAVDGDDADGDKLHAAWIDEVLRTALEADDQLLKAGKDVPASLVELPEHDTAIAPEFVFVDPTHAAAVLAPVHVFPPDTDLSASMKFGGLSCSAGDRMALHLRALNVPFGIVTNGERWMLVHAPTGEVATFASWYARIWARSPVPRVHVATRRAPLLRARAGLASLRLRAPAGSTRTRSPTPSAHQVRRAIEVLVQALDRADQDRNRELLRTEAAGTLRSRVEMMRLVFLLAAEERALLWASPATTRSTRSRHRAQAPRRERRDTGRRRASWSRLLAVFRAVCGIDHLTLRLPAMGGSLFELDRSVPRGTARGDVVAQPPGQAAPNRRPHGATAARSHPDLRRGPTPYRALDVEQIGHVYEAPNAPSPASKT